MDIFTSFKISASALKAHRIRLKRKNLLYEAWLYSIRDGTEELNKLLKRVNNAPGQNSEVPMSFKDHMDSHLRKASQGVQVTKIIEDTDPPQLVYNPDHPDADEDGYVALPNVNVLKEMVDLMNSTRSFQANATVIKSAKRMALKSLELGE